MNKVTAEDRLNVVRQRMLDHLRHTGAFVDNFGHIKYSANGKNYRYKFQKHTVRFEVQVLYEATQYSPATKEWLRVKTYNIKVAYDNIQKKNPNPVSVA